MRLTKIHFLWILPILLWSMVGRSNAAVDHHSASKVQAAYLFHLARLTIWPNAVSSDTIRIVVVGRDSDDLVENFREYVRKVPAGDLVLLIDNVSDLTDLDGQSDHPHNIIFFLENGKYDPFQPELLSLPNDTLLLGETSTFCRQGGTVGFILDQERIRIEINLEVAQKSGLKFGAELMQHATIVGRSVGGG